MVPRFGTVILPELGEETLRIALLAEKLGYDNLWVGDHCQYDVFSILTLLAMKTRHIRLGTSVTNVYTRHPAIIAAAIATVNEVSGGRAILGLGAAERVVGEQLFPPKHTYLHCKEAIEVIKPLLAGKTVTFDGKTVNINKYVLHMKVLNTPIYLAARGPMLLHLAGEKADGVFINGLGAWPQALKVFLQHVEAGANDAGRGLKELDIVSWARIAIAEDPETLRDMIRPVIGLALSYVREDILGENYGIGKEAAIRIKEKFRKTQKTWDPLRAKAVLEGDIEDIVPDSLIERYCLLGTPEDVICRIKHLLEAGATSVSLLNWPQYDRAEDLSQLRMNTLKIFADQVIPAFR